MEFWKEVGDAKIGGKGADVFNGSMLTLFYESYGIITNKCEDYQTRFDKFSEDLHNMELQQSSHLFLDMSTSCCLTIIPQKYYSRKTLVVLVIV